MKPKSQRQGGYCAICDKTFAGGRYQLRVHYGTQHPQARKPSPMKAGRRLSTTISQPQPLPQPQPLSHHFHQGLQSLPQPLSQPLSQPLPHPPLQSLPQPLPQTIFIPIPVFPCPCMSDIRLLRHCTFTGRNVPLHFPNPCHAATTTNLSEPLLRHPPNGPVAHENVKCSQCSKSLGSPSAK